jgi:hypothetical protein
MTSENKTWESVKTDYLLEVEKALSSVRHPRKREVLEDVRSHLNRRFAELKPDEQIWENFQAIITEMGPASDYAELLESDTTATARGTRQKHVLWVTLAVSVIVIAITLLTLAVFLKVSETDRRLASLISELSDPNAPRFVALSRIIELGSAAVPMLIQEMKTNYNWQIPKALGAIGDRRAILPLIEKLEKSSYSPMREVVGEALERITGEKFGTSKEKWRTWWQEYEQKMSTQDESAIETYIVTFKPAALFAPQTAGELLDAFNENHPRGVRTHHYRTEVRDNLLIGYICVDAKAGRDAIVTMLKESEKLKVLEANLATAESLQVLYQMGQPSPKEAPSQMTYRALSVSANRKLLDEQTLTELTRHEQFSAGWFKVEEAYEAASEDAKKLMIKQWITDATGDDFDKMTRAIAALGNVPAQEALDVLMNIAQKPKGGNRPRWMAVRALGRIGDMAAVPLLINLLDHYNSDTRLYAKVALAEITGIYFGDSKEKWSNWARQQGVEVKQMDVGQRQTTSTQSRTYPTRPPRSRYQTVSRIGNWPAGNCSVGGTVYREAGYGSVEHARVCLSSAELGSWVVATDYGRFDFDHIPAGVYTLRTTDTFGYKETSYNPENKPGESPSFRLKDGEERWQIRLKVEPVRPYLHVSGRILDEAGKPITNNQDLQVDAWLQLPQGNLKGCYRPVASSGVSQQDGSYLLRELDGRPIYVVVRDLNAYQKDDPYPPCYYPGTFSRSGAKMIIFDNHESLENADIQLAKKDGLALQGVVTDENTGEPVPNAMVVIRHADMLYDLFPAYTDERGSYRIEGLGDGSFLAYADAMYKGFVKTRKLFTIEPGTKETRLDIILRRGARISRKFVDEDGSPWQIERAHGSTSIPGAPYVGNASNFPYRNKYGPSVVWGTTVFYNQGEGDQPSSMMVYPTRDTFLIEAMMPGETRIQFSPRDPRGRVLEILHNGKNIKNELVSTEPGQELKDVTIVVGTSGGDREQRAQTDDRLQFALYDAFGREVHSQDYEGVPIFFEFGACW